MSKAANLNQTEDLKSFLTQTKRKKINPSKKNKKKEDEKEMARLMIDELFEIQKLKVPANCWKDSKRMEKLLLDICKTVNALTKCCAAQTRLTATELVARPTYVEELQNIRDNVNKAIIPKEFAAGLTANEGKGDDEEEEAPPFDPNYENISHLTKVSLRRGNQSKTQSAIELGSPGSNLLVDSPGDLTLEQVKEEDGSDHSQPEASSNAKKIKFADEVVDKPAQKP